VTRTSPTPRSMLAVMGSGVSKVGIVGSFRFR
jgi:hypothetical protein